MKTVYIVESEYDYEPCQVVRGFDDETEARAFMKSCEDYQKTRPSGKGKEVWEEWSSKHPAGFAIGSSYSVRPVDIYEKGET